MGMYSGGGTVSGLVVDADLDMGAYDLKTDDIKESTGAAGVVVDELIVKDGVLLTGGAIGDAAVHEKIASDNNRHAHSYDSLRTHDCSAWAKVAGMVFAKGLKGTIRVEVSVSSTNPTARGNVKFMLSGVQQGNEEDSGGHEHPTYEANTQDIAVDIPAGGVLEMWSNCDNTVHDVYAKLWKIDYDNAAAGVAVAMAEE
jgi:hypothetical protein